MANKHRPKKAALHTVVILKLSQDSGKSSFPLLITCSAKTSTKCNLSELENFSYEE